METKRVSCRVKGTSINLRRLYTNISHASTTDAQGVVVSLNAEKAFDLVEWEFLWQVLAKLNFGPNIISWVQLMYKNPSTRVKTNGILSPPFRLYRGNRHGCPLSPGLFVLAIDLLMSSGMVGGGGDGRPVNREALFICG